MKLNPCSLPNFIALNTERGSPKKYERHGNSQLNQSYVMIRH